MMNATKHAVMITIYSSMCQGKNHYTRSSVDKMQENLAKYHKIHVKRRWIFYCLAALLFSGLITRKTRYHHSDDGLINQIPSLFSITIKGMKYLVTKRVTGTWKLLKSMMKYVTGKDQRWPKKEDVQDGSYWPKDPDDKKRLKDLLGIIPKEMV